MAKKSAPTANGKKPPTKSEVFRAISEKTGVSRKDVKSVFEELSTLLSKNLKKSGAGAFTIPGLAKVVVKRIPAKPARKNVPNPFKPGELMDVAAKPARNVVKIRPLKALKDMV